MTRESLVRIAASSRPSMLAAVLAGAALVAGCAGARVEIHGTPPGKNMEVFVLACHEKTLDKFEQGSFVLELELQGECREWMRLSRRRDDAGKWAWIRTDGSERRGGISFKESAEGDRLSLGVSRGFAKDKHVGLVIAVDAEDDWSTPLKLKPDEVVAGETLEFQLVLGGKPRLARK